MSSYKERAEVFDTVFEELTDRHDELAAHVRSTRQECGDEIAVVVLGRVERFGAMVVPRGELEEVLDDLPVGALPPTPPGKLLVVMVLQFADGDLARGVTAVDFAMFEPGSTLRLRRREPRGNEWPGVLGNE